MPILIIFNATAWIMGERWRGVSLQNGSEIGISSTFVGFCLGSVQGGFVLIWAKRVSIPYAYRYHLPCHADCDQRIQWDSSEATRHSRHPTPMTLTGCVSSGAPVASASASDMQRDMQRDTQRDMQRDMQQDMHRFQNIFY